MWTCGIALTSAGTASPERRVSLPPVRRAHRMTRGRTEQGRSLPHGEGRRAECAPGRISQCADRRGSRPDPVSPRKSNAMDAVVQVLVAHLDEMWEGLLREAAGA